MSTRHLTRAFKATKNQSLGAYIADFRMATARRMLMAGHSVKAVAYSVGFTSPSNFSTAFRNATGMTPSDFKAGVTLEPRDLATVAD